MLKICLIILSVIFMAACEGETPKSAVDSPNVTVENPARIDIAPGESAEVVVAITVASEYHVQANPSADEFLIPLTIVFDEHDGLHIGKPVYPPPERHHFEWSPIELFTYSGKVLLPFQLSVDESITAGDRLLTGTLRYQACSYFICRPPKQADVRLAVRIVQ